MGAGVAKTFKARYPEMLEEYRKRCKAEPRQFNLGNCWLWKADRQPWVFNLGTQEGYWRSRASYEAIETALRSMRTEADAEDVARIAMPRIGVGFGGLSWKKVRAIIEAVFEDWKGTLVVYEEYVAGDSAETVVTSETRATRTSRSGTVSAPQERQTTRPRSTKAPATDIEPKGDAVVDTIRFYSVTAEYGCFSNFSPHRIRLKGKIWPTSEHYFQAQKFAGTPDEEEVRQAKSPMVAARMGRSRKRPLRKDWESVKDSLMHEAVLAKFTQHADLREMLLATGDRKIIEHTENDTYWGDGGDGSGKNRLGQILMRVRQELRSAPKTGDPPSTGRIR
jgi:ribA/ribD-fused uncharacterized protein